MKRLLLSVLSSKRLLALLVVPFLAITTATVWAYWSASGAGTGAAATATMQTVTLVALAGGDTPPSAALAPGGTSEVVLKVHNPNAFSVHVYSITAGAGSITADSGHSSLCTTTGVTFTAPAVPFPPNTSVPAGGSVVIRLADAASMDASSSNGCQGATFSIPITLVVRR